MGRVKVIELFAGVGGFRLGLEGWNGMSATSGYKNSHDGGFEVVWSNQWEPSTKTQHASMLYEAKWGNEGHSNQDINSVDVSSIPDHDLLVGGFPCQDYSVASTLKNSKGLLGKKGVLWWSIHKIISEKEKKPEYLILENVDRLLTSPSKQRGRDFAVILKSLADLGYGAEWRVINPADYGMPQRRKRTFIVAYHRSTGMFNRTEFLSWMTREGTIANAFPCKPKNEESPWTKIELDGDLVEISEKFNKGNAHSEKPFKNTGVMNCGLVFTMDTEPVYEGGFSTLGSILQKEEIPETYRISESDLERWKYLKGAKKESRKTADGFEYQYSEGSMTFPDALDRASRTIITGEGGSSPSRFKHVIMDENGFRRLTPMELERLNMFPDNHTLMKGVSDTKRAFFMGNALVVGVIEKLGYALLRAIDKNK
jgi:DNA (cytosine-5)-methyltransferase 1